MKKNLLIGTLLLSASLNLQISATTSPEHVVQPTALIQMDEVQKPSDQYGQPSKKELLIYYLLGEIVFGCIVTIVIWLMSLIIGIFVGGLVVSQAFSCGCMIVVGIIFVTLLILFAGSGFILRAKGYPERVFNLKCIDEENQKDISKLWLIIRGLLSVIPFSLLAQGGIFIKTIGILLVIVNLLGLFSFENVGTLADNPRNLVDKLLGIKLVYLKEGKKY